MIQIFQNIIESYKHIPYTWKHYCMVMQLQKFYIGYYKYKFHDVDKLIMYSLFPWLGTKRINKIHRKYAKHHLIAGKKNMHFDEAIIDWESARYTKPDKPLNAYQVYKSRYFEFGDDLLPYLRKFNLIDND